MRKENGKVYEKQSAQKASEKIVYTFHKRDLVDWIVALCFVLGGALAAQELGLVRWSNLIKTTLAWFGV